MSCRKKIDSFLIIFDTPRDSLSLIVTLKIKNHYYYYMVTKFIENVIKLISVTQSIQFYI